MLKIYGRANSINVRKILWLCEEIGLPYAREDWGRGFRPTSDPAFQQVSRFGLVPVIDDDGFVLPQSNAIIRYLAAKHDREDLYPSDARGRAAIDAWMDWVATDLFSGLRPVFIGLHVKTPEFADKPGAIEWGLWQWARQMQLLEAELAESGKPYLTGGTFTLADIPAGLVVNRWFGLDFEKPELPAVLRYYERLSERPAYRAHGRNGTP